MEKSVCGVIWEGSLAPSKTSYKELTAWNPSESRGSSSISKKRQVSLRTSRFHIGNNLFAPYLLFFLTDFSQVWYRWKAIFKGNPTLYVAKGRDCFLWKTSAITEIAPLGSSWSYLVNIQPGLILFGHFPLRLGSSYYQNPSRGRIILRNPIILSLYWSNSSEAFIYIFKSGYTLCDCLCLVAGLVPKSGHWLQDKLRGSLYLESHLRRHILKFLITMDSPTILFYNTLVAGLALQSTPIDWWCLYRIHGDYGS